MTRYESIRSNGARNMMIGAFLFSISIIIISLISEEGPKNNPYIVIGFSAFIITLFVLIWYRTYYIIENKKLKSVCGLFHLNTRIEDIKEIKAEYPFAGFKFTLSMKKGESIKIIRKKEIMPLYISPENQKEFIEELRKINPKIKIHENINLS